MKVKGKWYYSSVVLTQVHKMSHCIPLSKWAAIFFQVLAISLDVAHHAILPCELVMIRKMVDNPVYMCVYVCCIRVYVYVCVCCV